MTKLRTIDDVTVKGKRVLVRMDFNVPVSGSRVASDVRIRQAIPTITDLLGRGAGVILISHMGRPKGQRVSELSMSPVEIDLRTKLPDVDIKFIPDVVGKVARSAVDDLKPGQVLLLENIRFDPGEEINDPVFAAKLAEFADLYVNDAFSCAHRSHASIKGITKNIPSVAGRLMIKEIEGLDHVFESPELPVGAVIGGSKISTKLGVLRHLVTEVQHLVIGGAMANTFLYAQGHDVGKSLCEVQMKEIAAEILSDAHKRKCEVLLPEDVVVAATLEENTQTEIIDVNHVFGELMILDVGPKTLIKMQDVFESCNTILWNGPLGAFEVKPFELGTIKAARWVADLTRKGKLTSIAGGGDTLAALERAGVLKNFTHVTMAGGAFLDWIEGRPLPGVEVLKSI